MILPQHNQRETHLYVFTNMIQSVVWQDGTKTNFVSPLSLFVKGTGGLRGVAGGTIAPCSKKMQQKCPIGCPYGRLNMIKCPLGFPSACSWCPFHLFLAPAPQTSYVCDWSKGISRNNTPIQKQVEIMWTNFGMTVYLHSNIIFQV